MAAINGFDSFGHYLRAGLIVNQCANYSIEPGFGCSANFPRAASARRPAPSASRPARPGAPAHGAGARGGARAAGARSRRDEKPTRKERKRRAPPERQAARRRAAERDAGARRATPAPQQGSPSQTETLLDYLFGDDR